jgi:hypothetical protein
LLYNGVADPEPQKLPAAERSVADQPRWLRSLPAYSALVLGASKRP